MLDELVVDRLSPRVDAVFGPTLSAPPVEEAAKGLALAIVFLGSAGVGRRRGWYEFQGVTDGLVYGAAVGLGFAFGENLYYLAELSDSLAGSARWTSLGARRRPRPGALGHALYAAVFGAALGATVWVRGPAAKAAVAFGGFLAATGSRRPQRRRRGPPGAPSRLGGRRRVAHDRRRPAGGRRPPGRRRGLALRRASVVEAGLVAACVAAGGRLALGERRALRRHLAAEAAAGTITAEEAAAIPAFRRRWARYARLLRDRDVAGYRRRRRLDGAIVELGLRRWRGAGRRGGRHRPRPLPGPRGTEPAVRGVVPPTRPVVRSRPL